MTLTDSAPKENKVYKERGRRKVPPDVKQFLVSHQPTSKDPKRASLVWHSLANYGPLATCFL